MVGMVVVVEGGGGVVNVNSLTTSATSMRVSIMAVRAGRIKKVGITASIHNDANGIDLGGCGGDTVRRRGVLDPPLLLSVVFVALAFTSRYGPLRPVAALLPRVKAGNFDMYCRR